MDIKTIIESLHPLEQKAVGHLKECKTLSELVVASGLSEVEAMRALQWLENKGVLKIKTDVREVIKLSENGRLYLKKGLPERRFLESVKEKELMLADIMKVADLSKEELNACIGLLKKKAAIEFAHGNISITNQGCRVLEKEWLEETFLKKIEGGEVGVSELMPEEKFAFDIFVKRKDIVEPVVIKTKRYSLTQFGEELCSSDVKIGETVDRLTPEMLKTGEWKGKTFRRYDVTINVPKISRGKRHFVNQAVDYIKKIWLELGFTEMEGGFVQTGFWDLDALFVPQDHPAREMQDTFYLKKPKFGKLPDEKLVGKIKDVHENGGDTGSTGWKYKFSTEFAKENILRTHTTVLSAQTIAKLKKEDLPGKFFSVGKVFRNEALDASHLFEFYQVEGIVIDPNVTFRHLLGYLKLFFKKMGYLDVRIRPAHFPYTEPSVEVDVLHPTFNKWIELGGAGIFRPEVVKPLLGVDVPVLAWGMGMGRIISEYYDIKDVRELYKNDLKQSRSVKTWMR